MSDDVRVALLRGVNVGGHNRLPMAVLSELVSELGGDDVRTYIQSGNVVFRSRLGEADISRRLEASIAERAGVTTPVIVRTGDELAATVAANPFVAGGIDDRALAVAFLADRPIVEAIATLDPERSPPDELAVGDRAVYLHLPNGVARTRLTNAYLDRRLGTVSTVRNWRTTCRLLAIARELDGE